MSSRRQIGLARSGRDIVHLEVGQPQSSAPQASIRLAQEQLGADRCGYTAARGEPPLRDAIAGMYEKTYGVKGVAGADPPHARLVWRLYDCLYGCLRRG